MKHGAGIGVPKHKGEAQRVDACPGALGRRQFLRLSAAAIGLTATAPLLGACGANAAPAPSAGAPPSSLAPKPAASASAAPAGAPASGGKIEKPDLKVAIPLEALTFLPMYIVNDRTGKEQGLNVQLLAFRGDAESAQALAGDSVDINLASMNGLINLITANQPVKGFYMGFYQVTFDWVAQKDIKTWDQLKGHTAGVSTYGSLTDFLTRYVLQKHGLEATKDVQIIQSGTADASYAALKSGKLGLAIMAAPWKWRAEDEGFTKLGSQDKEVAPEWPVHVYMAKTKFMDQYPNTMLALLKAHVNAIRLAKSDKAYTMKVLNDRIKATADTAARMYDEVIGGYNERGTPPEKSMPTFWKIMVEGKFVTEPWPESKYLDPRFINTFDQWAPK